MEDFVFAYPEKTSDGYTIVEKKCRFIDYKLNNDVNRKRIPNTISKKTLNSFDYALCYMKLFVLRKAKETQRYEDAKKIIRLIDETNKKLSILSVYNESKAKEWFEKEYPNSKFNQKEYISIVSIISLKITMEMCARYIKYME